LLKHFADESGMLWEYDTELGKTEQKNKKDVAVIRDFYATGEESGEIDYETLEVILQRVESEAAPVIEYLLAHKRQIATSSIIKFLFFVAVQYVRTPALMRRLNALCEPEAKKQELLDELSVSLRERLSGAGAFPEQIDEMVTKAREDAGKCMAAKDVVKRAALRQVETATDELIKLSWAFLDVPDGEPDLLLGDHPVLLQDAGPDEVPLGPLGLRNPYLQIIVPISRRMIAIGGFDVKCSYGKLLPGVSDSINDLTLRFANRFIFGSGRSEKTLARAIELRDSGPRQRVFKFRDERGRLIVYSEFS
jgi:hypothetical protein